MKTVHKTLSKVHGFILMLLAVLSVPMFFAMFFMNLTTGGARLMEKLAPLWGWLTLAWALSAAYFFCCLAFSTSFRERLLTRLAGFKERDEREEMVTAKAARAVYLVTLAGFIAAGLVGMVRINIFSYTRWQGDKVPPISKVGPYQLRRGTVEKRGLTMWPGLGLSGDETLPPKYTERKDGPTLYFYESGSLFGSEIAKIFFALALIQILLLHLFARRTQV